MSIKPVTFLNPYSTQKKNKPTNNSVAQLSFKAKRKNQDDKREIDYSRITGGDLCDADKRMAQYARAHHVKKSELNIYDFVIPTGDGEYRGNRYIDDEDDVNDDPTEPLGWWGGLF